MIPSGDRAAASILVPPKSMPIRVGPTAAGAGMRLWIF